MLTRIKTLTRDWAEDRRKNFIKNRNSKTLTMCESCYAFYYKNSWHLKKPAYLGEGYEEEVPVFFTQCPACLEQENALYDMESSLILGNG